MQQEVLPESDKQGRTGCLEKRKDFSDSDRECGGRATLGMSQVSEVLG
jgi:hypothetical protein